MKTVFKICCIFFFISASLWADGTSSPWYRSDTNKKITLNVELFLSSTCPHCHKAEAFFNKIGTTTPDLHIKRYVINEDKKALLRFNRRLNEENADDFAVPSIYFCNSRWVGFASEKTTGKDLLHAIHYCKQQIEKKGKLTSATIETLRHWANANKFDAGMVGKPSSLHYISIMALTDAISPCAFFCFFSFLAFLWVCDESKKRVMAGILFLMAVVLTHYIQQVYTSLFYEMLAWLRILAALSGGLGIYLVIKDVKKQVEVKAYFLAAFLLGLMTMTYQQTCDMNWSYIFQQWLNNQPISGVNKGFYQALYQGIYVFPLILVLIVYQILLKTKRVSAWQSRLHTMSLLFILVISLGLIIYPVVFSSLGLSLGVLLGLVVCSYFLNWA